MSLTKRVGLLAGAGALVLSGGALADTTQEATTEDLKARIAELESRLAAVESRESGAWLTEQRAREIKALVADVLADAEGRSSLLAQGVGAGYDDGFMISDGTGNNTLKLNMLMQQRFVLNFMGDGPGAPADTDQWAFENTRSRVTLSGNIVSPEWFYKLEVNFGNNGGTVFDEDSRVDTLDAYLGYDFGDGFKVYGGTFKAPLLREELIDSMYQLAVERSNVNYLFSTSRVDGIMVEYTADAWRAMGSYNDGSNTGQTSWFVPFTDFAVTGRGEFMIQGSWDQFEDFTSWEGDEMGILVGGGLHYQNADTDAGLADIDILTLTFDAQVEFGGANVYGAFIYSNLDLPAAFGVSDLDQWGFVVQGGYQFADSWEGFGRLEYVDADTGASDDFSLVTLGIIKYFSRHNAKWTTDFGVALDPVVGASQITGFRDDGPDEDGQVVIRTQLQLAF